MKKPILIFISVITTAAAVYFYISSSSNAGQIQVLDADNISLQSEIEKTDQQYRKLQGSYKGIEQQLKLQNQEMQNLNDKLNILSKRLAEKDKEIAEAKSGSVAVAEPAKKEASRSGRRDDFFKSMVSRQIDNTYGELFKSMKLSDEEKALVRGTLVKRNSEMAQVFMKAFTKTLEVEDGETQEQALARNLLSTIQEHEGVLKSDIGDSYSEFQKKEKESYANQQLSEYKRMLKGDSQLSEEQEGYLGDLLTASNDSILQDVSSGDATFKDAHEALVETSSESLSESQRKSLSRYFKFKRGGR